MTSGTPCFWCPVEVWLARITKNWGLSTPTRCASEGRERYLRLQGTLGPFMRGMVTLEACARAVRSLVQLLVLVVVDVIAGCVRCLSYAEHSLSLKNTSVVVVKPRNGQLLRNY